MARPITIEDLYNLQFLDRPRISPDGKRVAYVVTRIDDQKHAYRSSIWISSVNGGEARRFTQETEMTSDPAWSPDGRWLAFVAKREGGDLPQVEPKDQKKLGKDKPQIWIMPTDGGEARQITFMEHGASSPIWSPDSQKLLFSAQVGPTDKETDEGKPLPKVHVIDQLWYRLDGVGFIYNRRSHLFLTSPEGGTPQQLTDGDWNDSSAAWSPDGQQIAFISDREDERWRIPGGDVYVLSLQDGKAASPRRLTDGSMSCASPSWSPDGQTLAFLAAKKIGSAGHTYLYTISANTGGEPRNLTPEFDGTGLDFTNSDIGDEHLMPAPTWSADGQNLYILSSHRGSTRIYTISATDGAGKQPPTVTPGNLHTRDFSIDAAKQTLAMTIADATHPQEIYVCSTESQEEPRKITSFNDAILSELQLATPEYFTYEGADGWPMDGWILKPSDFDPSKKYPLVLEIHGGPHTQYGYGFFHEMQFLVAEGYVVLYTNPRGSCGYGFDFAHAVRGAWGEKDSIDIMNGVAEVVQRGYIDTSRMGVTGGSYGGFMTNYLVSHNNRFKVAITDRCVSNMATMFGASDIGWDLGYDNLETTPWEDLEKYMNMSPIKYVQNIRTPLLIIHSDQDLRCSIEQAEQLYAALKYMGRETRLVRFEGQSHGLSRGGHPHSRLERLRHIQSWFAQHLQ